MTINSISPDWGDQSKLSWWEEESLDPNSIKSLMRVKVNSMTLCLSKFQFSSRARNSHPHTTLLNACSKRIANLSKLTHSNLIISNTSQRLGIKELSLLRCKILYLNWEICLKGGEIQKKTQMLLTLSLKITTLLWNMLWTLSTISCFWPDWLVFECCFHKLSSDLVSLAFHQPLVEVLGHSDHFHIVEQLMSLVRSANFWRWFGKLSPDLASLTAYQPMVMLIPTTCMRCPIICVTSMYTPYLLSNAF